MKEKESAMDIKINYIEEGQGDPIILLHGNGEDSSYFEPQIDVLKEKFHVFALDSRGHGKTEFGEKDLTIRQLAQDLDDFIEEKNLKKVSILGFSDGANIAMIYALGHPEKVDKLILNGGNLAPEGMIDKVYKAIKRHYDKALEDSSHDEEALKKAKLFSLMVNDPFIDKNDLKKIQNRALVIAGSKDMIREDHTREIAEYLPNSELVILEGDHFVSNKEPEAFNKVMMEFLEG